jgi:hypothetical protein
MPYFLAWMTDHWLFTYIYDWIDTYGSIQCNYENGQYHEWAFDRKFWIPIIFEDIEPAYIANNGEVVKTEKKGLNGI